MADEQKTDAPAAEPQAGYERPKAAGRPPAPPAQTESAPDARNMDMLLDVPVPVVAQLGSTEMRIREILRLAPGSVIELEKLAGEPVDVYVRGQNFAQGEVVVVDDNFGIRITRIISASDRAESPAPAR
jgi:flagellar motor switch protein FliN/FliY